MKEDMYCDVETGICGPTDESSPVSGFIDLSAQANKSESVNVDTEKDKTEKR